MTTTATPVKLSATDLISAVPNGSASFLLQSFLNELRSAKAIKLQWEDDQCLPTVKVGSYEVSLRTYWYTIELWSKYRSLSVVINEVLLAANTRDSQTIGDIVVLVVENLERTRSVAWDEDGGKGRQSDNQIGRPTLRTLRKVSAYRALRIQAQRDQGEAR